MQRKFSSKCAVKKECKVSKTDKKILNYLYENREGLRVKTILKLTGLKERNTYKRLKYLCKWGIVVNEFPLWKLVDGQVKFCSKLLKSDKKYFELHHPAYVVKLLDIPKWWNPKGTQMRNKLMMIKSYQFKQIDFGKNSSNPYIQLKNDRFVIQMYPESVIVIHRKRYYSDNPYNLTIDFMNDFYDLWLWFEDRLKFRFFKDGVPQMTLRGHDYNRINDWLANYVRDKIEHRFLVEIGEGRKVWVDLSEPFGKEANTPEIQEMLEKVTKDRILNKPLLPSEIQGLVVENLKAINNVTQNQVMFAKNIEKHMKILDEMGKTLKKIQESL